MLSAFLTGGIPAGLFFRTCNSLIGRHCPSVLALPPHVDVARFDILPTRQATATGASRKDG